MNGNNKPINWFPGHMAVTRRLMRNSLSDVDVVFELLDARIPQSSRNPEIIKLLQGKPSVILLNKADLADPDKTSRWQQKLRSETARCVFVDSKSGKGLSDAINASKELLKDKWKQYEAKGISKPIRAMVVGIPNVGKSTLINRLAGAKKAKAENRPGVTKTKQWVKAGKDLELLDMPGILWPKFEDETVGKNLAMTGAIRDGILDCVEIAVLLCESLIDQYPALLTQRYHLSEDDLLDTPYEVFLKIGKARGMLQGKGEINEERCANMLLDEFRNGVIGRITLEDTP